MDKEYVNMKLNILWMKAFVLSSRLDEGMATSSDVLLALEEIDQEIKEIREFGELKQ